MTMVKKLSVIFAFTAPLMLFGQLINNFEVEPDTSFWDYETSESADSTLSYTNLTINLIKLVKVLWRLKLTMVLTILKVGGICKSLSLPS